METLVSTMTPEGLEVAITTTCSEANRRTHAWLQVSRLEWDNRTNTVRRTPVHVHWFTAADALACFAWLTNR